MIRSLVLASFLYVTYTLNNLLEAKLFVSAYSSLSSFMLISNLVPSLVGGLVISLLFSPPERSRSLSFVWRSYFAAKNWKEWWWRFLAAVVAFMPVYLFFGFLVTPFTRSYYEAEVFGLRAAGWGEILPVLLLRSVLFFLVCLPVVVLWQGSRKDLFFSLGTSLFLLVGFIYMLTGYWLPWHVRVPHTIEIFLDSFGYSGVLVWLLTGDHKHPQ